MSGLTERLRGVIDNRLDPAVDGQRWIAGIIGDKPSTFAKSPSLWNAAFRTLEMDARYVAYDVTPDKLGPLVTALRESAQVVGGSVTMPYKTAIMEYLDELDPLAERIGAVNTYARTAAGRLCGFNTDGSGGLRSLTDALPGQSEPFLASLAGKTVLLIGSGGAARAMAFYLAQAIGKGGSLTIANRDPAKAQQLAGSLRTHGGVGEGAGEAAVAALASRADVIVNATTKGQLGLRRSSQGVTCLEGYSSLAPAAPPTRRDAGSDAEFLQWWFGASRDDRAQNNARSEEILSRVPLSTACMDLIYAPLETTFLRQARLSGHRTLNGKGMNLAQAADAFVHCVMGEALRVTGRDPTASYAAVFDAMARVW